MNDLVKVTGDKWKSFTEDQNITVPSLAQDLIKYQKPEEHDSLLKIQKNLDEIRDVMVRNIDEVLKRGETLDDLMQRSEDLSGVAYQFYKGAKRQNQCCKMY